MRATEGPLSFSEEPPRPAPPSGGISGGSAPPPPAPVAGGSSGGQPGCGKGGPASRLNWSLGGRGPRLGRAATALTGNG